MIRTLVFVSALVAVTVTGSPHGDALPSDFGSRYSNSVLEDARLDAPDLISKYGYPSEVHEVTTLDGYILQMHRIPHGRDNNNQPGPRPVVFLMHGLLSSSADWVNMGPGKGFGYILAEEGFDVWMGNARGTYYSRRHVSRNPDSGSEFWEFSWHEIGNIDLAAMIDYALGVTGRLALHYAGHSQGTTSFFALLSTRPEYNAKILSMHALAPVAYMSNQENRLFSLISPYSHSIVVLGSLIGINEFLPNRELTTWLGQLACRDNLPLQPMCANIFFLMGGYNEDQFNNTMIPVKLGHTPAGAATRQFAHYGQGIVSSKFRQYDHGPFENVRRYRSLTPPDYNLRRITAPVCLHYSVADPLAHVTDVDQLYSELPNVYAKVRIPHETFSHIDFIWGIDVKELVYDKVIGLIRELDK